MLSALEMWVWKRTEKISCIDRVTNDEVLQRVQEFRSILDTERQCKLRWIGHILQHDSQLQYVMEGRMMRKAIKGRKHLQMLSDITSKDYVTLKIDAEDRCSCQRSVITLSLPTEDQKRRLNM